MSILHIAYTYKHILKLTWIHTYTHIYLPTYIRKCIHAYLQYGCTPLHIASRKAPVEVVKYLCEKTGDTMLMWNNNVSSSHAHKDMQSIDTLTKED